MKRHITAVLLAAMLTLCSCGKDKTPPPDSYVFASYPVLQTTYEDVTAKLGEGTGAQIVGGFSSVTIAGTLYGKDAKISFSFDNKGILIEESTVYCDAGDTATYSAIYLDLTERFGASAEDSISGAPTWKGVDGERIYLTTSTGTDGKKKNMEITMKRERDYYLS